MPSNPQIPVPPTTNQVQVTDAFLQAPGKEFWESPGRERRSGAVPPNMLGIKVIARKFIHGVTPLGMGYNWPSDPILRRGDFLYTHIFNRFLTQVLVSKRDLSFPSGTYTTLFTANSSINPTTGVPSTTGQPTDWTHENGQFVLPMVNHRMIWMPPKAFYVPWYTQGEPAQVRHTINSSTHYHVDWSGYNPGIAPPGPADQDGALSGLVDPKSWHDYARDFVESQIHVPTWTLWPDGRFESYQCREFQPGIGVDYTGHTFPGNDGSFRLISGGSFFVANEMEHGWQYHLSTAERAIVEVSRLRVRFPDNDPFSQRLLFLRRRNILDDGTITITPVVQVILPRGQEFELPAPAWSSTLRGSFVSVIASTVIS